MTRKASIHFGPDSQTLRDEVHGIRTLSKSQTTKTSCRTSARQTFGLGGTSTYHYLTLFYYNFL